MNDESKIKEALNYIQLQEGETFECDEEAIVAAYEQARDNQHSLVIKVMSILGGFLAAPIFVGFLLIGGLYDSAIGLIVLGFVSIFAAIWINKTSVQLITDTASVSLYLIGFLVIALGVDQQNTGGNFISILFIILSILTISIIQNYMLSFVSILIINGSFLFLIISNNVYNVLHLYVSVLAIILAYWFLKEAKIITLSKKLSKIYIPIRIGLVFSFIKPIISWKKRIN